jgi:hypothetical protein
MTGDIFMKRNVFVFQFITILFIFSCLFSCGGSSNKTKLDSEGDTSNPVKLTLGTPYSGHSGSVLYADSLYYVEVSAGIKYTITLTRKSNVSAMMVISDISTWSTFSFLYGSSGYTVADETSDVIPQVSSLGIIVESGSSSGAEYTITVSEAEAAPVAPAGVSAIAQDLSVNLTWTTLGNLSYNVYYAEGSTVSKTSYTGVAKEVTSPYTVSGLTNGIKYSFIVTAVNKYGESSDSVIVSKTPNTVPSAPCGVFALGGYSSNTITWNSVSGATGYNVYYSIVEGAGKTGTKISNGSSLKCYHSPSGNTGVSYYYTVTAVNGDTESSVSSEVRAVYGISAPTSVVVFPGNGMVSLQWNGSSTGSYNIYYSQTSPVTTTHYDGKLTGISPGLLASTATIAGLTNSLTYYFVVTYVSSSGESSESVQIAATLVNPVSEFPQMYNFDDGSLQGWSSVTVSSASPVSTWGVTSSSSNSGSYSITDSPAGNCASDERTAIVSPLFDLTGLTTPQLTFYQKRDMVLYTDWGEVDISIDGGRTWTSIANYSNSLTTWTLSSVSLSSYKSNNVKIRFFLIINSTGHDGWYLDDIKIQ